MKEILFYKYQGAGNDFIMIDDRQNTFPEREEKLIKTMCHRRFGVGADGLILLRTSAKHDFSMLYFNSDGREGTMCGNGGRCIVAFARDNGIFFGEKTTFEAIDGEHQAFINENEVRLGMANVDEIISMNEKNEERYSQNYFLNTGSPHYVTFIQNEHLMEMDVEKCGRDIRNNDFFAPKGGTNVNFAMIKDEIIHLRTYERGVESETLACGTGATAVALAAHFGYFIKSEKVQIKALGGYLVVDFEEKNGKYKNIFLTGEAKKVFSGKFEQK